ncbi:hypothetical protein ACTNEO_03680 [Gracilibacillus sp. HCP3S3_G5_1]|uniref:hypothetical protein n=1 Tax=unclassified Gracilibacillus TaxID=2625209 RepID=UPI003F8CEB3D
MAEEVWKEMIRVTDVLLLTMQAEVFFVFYIVSGLIIMYYLFQPFVKFMMVLEWNTLLTVIFVVLLMFLITSTLTDVPDWRYVLYGILIFSIIISIKRSIAIMKKKQPHSN